MDQSLFGEKEYKEVHELAYKYQNGDNEAAMELLDRFSSFKIAFAKLIILGEFDISNTSIRNFIKLFIDNPTDRSFINLYNIVRAKDNANVENKMNIVTNKAVSIITSIFSKLDEEDVKQNIDLALLEMFSKYKDTKPSLHHYVKKSYHFYLYRLLEKESKDPLARGQANGFITRNIDNSYEFSDNANVLNVLHDEQAKTDFIQADNNLEVFLNYKKNGLNLFDYDDEEITIYEDNFFDQNWIEGSTCSPIFKSITKIERAILVLWYIRGFTDSHIAEVFNACRPTINKKRSLAKKKLYKEAVKRNYIKE